MNRDVHVDFGVVRGIVQSGVEETNASLFVADGCNGSLVAASQAEGNRVAASTGGNAVVQIVAPAIE